jgi:hypothetical protein
MVQGHCLAGNDALIASVLHRPSAKVWHRIAAIMVEALS